MVGFITERDLELAEESFPGIGLLFRTLPHKPRTFLELLARFDHWCEAPCAPRGEARSERTPSALPVSIAA